MAGYRGRLIFPFMGTFALVDPVDTALDPDGAGEETSGFDPDFRETVMVPGGPGSPARGVDARQETLVEIPFQEDIERYADANRGSPLLSGSSPDADIYLIFHYADLERLGLVDLTTGRPLIQRDSRLVSVAEYIGTWPGGTPGTLIQTIRTPPGLYVQSLTPAFGLRQTRNLLFVHLQARAMSVEAAP